MLSRIARKANSSNVSVNCTCAQSTKVAPAAQPTVGEASERIFKKETKCGAHNYNTLPVALARGKGIYQQATTDFSSYKCVAARQKGS